LIRDLPRLAEREFDVLVVGGGIYGLTIAYDAAQRGLTVALVERGDFGAATSFNHLKTIHGGLRYLQSADFRRMRESNRERRAFARIAPRLVAPLAFAMPTGASLTRTRLAFKAAFALDAAVGRDRNEGVDATLHLPAGRVVAGSECRSLFEGVSRSVASAAVWYDYQTTSGDRLTLAFAKAAARHGAVLANYAEACGPLRDGKRVAGVSVHDSFSGQQFDARARVVVNAAGPWAMTVLDRSGVGTRWRLLKAMNVVTSRPARHAALVGRIRGGRALVLLPWQGRTVIGTSESHDEHQADDQQARRSEVDAFVSEINETFPALALSSAEITLVHRGIVPAKTIDGRLTLLGHSRIIDHAREGAPGLMSIVGVKYTTARAVAEQAVDQIFRQLGRVAPVCRTADTVLPGAGRDDRDAPEPVLHAIRDEMAHTLIDVIVRRLGVGAAGHPGEQAANDVAGRMQTALGWSPERKQRELDALRAFYDIV
jgi:glycerol-3-phosphate dehydrogenase